MESIAPLRFWILRTASFFRQIRAWLTAYVVNAFGACTSLSSGLHVPSGGECCERLFWGEDALKVVVAIQKTPGS
jgi:hypothetical protein